MTTVGLRSSLRGPIGPGKHTFSSLHWSRPHLIGVISSDLQKATVELQATLGHSSPFHENRNVPALKAAVLEVENLIDWLSEFTGTVAAKTKERIGVDRKLGWDGIVKEPARGRRVQRPEVNLDEEDRLYL